MVRTIVTSVFLLLLTRSAGATAVLLSDLRTVGGAADALSGGVSDHDDASQVPAVPFTPFNVLVEYEAQSGTAGAGGRLSQNSSVTGSLFSGSGSMELALVAFGRQDPDESSAVNGNTTFDIFFRLLEPHTFALSGLLSAAPSARLGAASASFVLVGPAGFSFVVSPAPGDSESTPVSDSGLLPAGDYRFTAGVTGSDSATASTGAATLFTTGGFNFEFLLSPSAVPEPVSLWLLAFGALAALGRRRSAR